MRDNFISTIVNFDTEDVTDEVRAKMKKYLDNPDYNFEKVSFILSFWNNLHQRGSEYPTLKYRGDLNRERILVRTVFRSPVFIWSLYVPMVPGDDESPLHVLSSLCLGRYRISYIPV